MNNRIKSIFMYTLRRYFSAYFPNYKSSAIGTHMAYIGHVAKVVIWFYFEFECKTPHVIHIHILPSNQMSTNEYSFRSLSSLHVNPIFLHRTAKCMFCAMLLMHLMSNQKWNFKFDYFHLLPGVNFLYEFSLRNIKINRKWIYERKRVANNIFN